VRLSLDSPDAAQHRRVVDRLTPDRQFSSRLAEAVRPALHRSVAEASYRNAGLICHDGGEPSERAGRHRTPQPTMQKSGSPTEPARSTPIHIGKEVRRRASRQARDMSLRPLRLTPNAASVSKNRHRSLFSFNRPQGMWHNLRRPRRILQCDPNGLGTRPNKRSRQGCV